MAGLTPLHMAASLGDKKKVRKLLKDDRYDNCVDWPWGALHVAASEGHLNGVRVLASEFKAEVNARDGDGHTSLHEAASEGHLDVVRVLALEFKADVSAHDEDGDTPLHNAATKGHLDVVRVLIESKANVSAHNKY